MTNKRESLQWDTGGGRREADPGPDWPAGEDLPPDLDDDTPLELDDDSWDAFLPDDDELDPAPEPGDFWMEFDQLERRPWAA